MTELRPCPFCGGEAEVLVLDYGIYHEHHVYGVFCKRDVDEYYCHGHYVDNYATEEEAIAAWNGVANDRA